MIIQKATYMGFRDRAKTPVVLSFPGCSVSMPTRKLLPNEMRLRKNSSKPNPHRNTPTQENASERKNSCSVTAGRPRGAAITMYMYKKANGGMRKSFLSMLAKYTALIPALLIRRMRVMTSPRKSTMVNEAISRCIPIFSSFLAGEREVGAESMQADRRGNLGVTVTDDHPAADRPSVQLSQ